MSAPRGANRRAIATGVIPLLALAALVAARSAGAEWQMPPDLADEVAQHFGVRPQQLLLRAGGGGGSSGGEAAANADSGSWAPEFSIRRELPGRGFHRTLTLRVERATAAAADGAGGGGGGGGCRLSLLQPLPSSIFADPYQLKDLARSPGGGGGSAYGFQLLGPLDLELPAPACKATALVLQFNLTRGTHSTAGPAASLSVPLHAKYPQPQSFGLQGWHALATGHVAVAVPWPWLVEDCRPAGGELRVLAPPPDEQQRQQQQQQQGRCAARGGQQGGAAEVCDAGWHEREGSLLWSVPAGNLDHQQVVSWGTLAVTWACCAALVLRALRVMAAEP